MDASNVYLPPVPPGKVPTVGDIVDIIESGVDPSDKTSMGRALEARGFHRLWAISPVIGDVYVNHQKGAYSGGTLLMVDIHIPYYRACWPKTAKTPRL